MFNKTFDFILPCAGSSKYLQEFRNGLVIGNAKAVKETLAKNVTAEEIAERDIYCSWAIDRLSISLFVALVSAPLLISLAKEIDPLGLVFGDVFAALAVCFSFAASFPLLLRANLLTSGGNRLSEKLDRIFHYDQKQIIALLRSFNEVAGGDEDLEALNEILVFHQSDLKSFLDAATRKFRGADQARVLKIQSYISKLQCSPKLSQLRHPARESLRALEWFFYWREVYQKPNAPHAAC